MGKFVVLTHLVAISFVVFEVLFSRFLTFWYVGSCKLTLKLCEVAFKGQVIRRLGWNTF